MKLIKQVDPPCPCQIKIHEFFLTQVDENGNPTLGIGSVVECDCGQNWVYTDFPIQGKVWVRKGRTAPTDKAWLE